MIQQACIEQVKYTADVVEVIGKYIPLKKEGSSLLALCPFHDEKSPSFKVSQQKQLYKCFGCGKSGDSISFIMEHNKVNYIQAIKVLAEMYHIDLIDEEPYLPNRVYVKPTPPKIKVTDIVKDYFAARKINSDTTNYFRITSVNEWMPKAKKEVETICFPYYKHDELINIKYRAKDKDFKLFKDAERIFYNIDSTIGKDYVVITEGEIDCMSVYQSGGKSVISVPNGASKGVQNLDYLNNCFDWFKNMVQIILFVDNDECGLLLRDELARRFGFDRCLRVEYPEGCKDANDVLIKHGEQKIKEMIKNAKEFPIEGVFSMDDLYEDVNNYYVNGYPQGLKVGIPDFDDYMSFMLGQFTTITGLPGSGKSEFTDWIVTEAAKNHSWKTAICSFENQPASLHVTKIMEKFIGKSFARRFNDEDRISPTELIEAVSFVGSNFHFININKVTVTLEGILEKIKELVLRYGVRFAVIDPWNYIEHKRNGMTETDYVSECLTKIKAFCLTHNVHLILIAHPVKMAKVGGKYEVPTLYNISGSAHFFNKTDNGLTVYRNYETNEVEIYIQKIRYSWLGKLGNVSYQYDTNRRKYITKNDLFAQEQKVPDDPHAGIKKAVTLPLPKGVVSRDISEPKPSSLEWDNNDLF